MNKFSFESIDISNLTSEDIEAIYQMDEGMHRAIVLLNILNKETPLHIDKKALNKI